MTEGSEGESQVETVRDVLHMSGSFFDLFSCYLDFFARVMSYFLEFFTLDIFGTKNLLFAKKA